MMVGVVLVVVVILLFGCLRSWEHRHNDHFREKMSIGMKNAKKYCKNWDTGPKENAHQ